MNTKLITLIQEHLNDLRNAADRLRLTDVELFREQSRAMLAKAEEWDAALVEEASWLDERQPENRIMPQER